MARSILFATFVALAVCLQATVHAAINTPLRIKGYHNGLYARLDTTQDSPDRPILADSVQEDTGRVWDFEYPDPSNDNLFQIRNWHTGERATARAAENVPVLGQVYEQSQWEQVLNNDQVPDYFVRLAGTNLVWTLVDDNHVLLTNQTGAANQLWEFEILV
ncbi:hypothetical protein BGW42_003017 [Actinomortierella wolfii]|nr:hypothetical protein BGW42_003017 [Actinomortierella wolfii]